MAKAEKVCIIGAGSSGITASQVLRRRGDRLRLLRDGLEIGRQLALRERQRLSSAYRSLHINTSRKAMEYAALPMPDDFPDYPSHWQIAGYFDDFVDHFGLRDASPSGPR